MLLDWLTNGKKGQQASEDKMQHTVQEHWPDDPIDLENLIRESWVLAEDKKTRIYKYVVFIDKKLNIDWLTADDSFDKYSSQICQAQALESIPHKHLPRKQILAFKNLIGEAIVAFLEKDSQGAQELIAKAKQYVFDKTFECSCKWLLSFATIIITPILLTGIAVWYSNPTFCCEQRNLWLISCFWSTIGTYLSIIRKVGKQPLDSSAGYFLHFLRVSTQMLAGAVLGVVAYFLLSIPFLCPPFFQDLKNYASGFCLFGFIAGFVEQFIPNIITVLQKKEEKNE